jgi:hypothetical protein
MLFLVNPPRKGRGVAKKRRKTKRRRTYTAKQRAAGFGGKAAKTRARKTKRRGARKVRAIGKLKRKGVSTVARRKGSKRGKRRTSRRRRSTGTITLRRVRGAVYRKNPGFSVRGIGTQLIEGAKGAGAVVVGKAAGRLIANLLPFPKTTMIGNVGAQIVSALVLGVVGKRFLPGRIGEYVFIGALTAPVETVLKGVPVIGPMLGEDPFLPIGEDPFLPIGAYPDGLSAYPEEAQAQPEDYQSALMY